eukprot:133621-Prorocentrum_minimum.AAC.3
MNIFSLQWLRQFPLDVDCQSTSRHKRAELHGTVASCAVYAALKPHFTTVSVEGGCMMTGQSIQCISPFVASRNNWGTHPLWLVPLSSAASHAGLCPEAIRKNRHTPRPGTSFPSTYRATSHPKRQPSSSSAPPPKSTQSLLFPLISPPSYYQLAQAPPRTHLSYVGAGTSQFVRSFPGCPARPIAPKL